MDEPRCPNISDDTDQHRSPLIQLQRARADLDEQVLERLSAERVRIAEDEQRKARLLLGAELATKQQELIELNTLFASQQRRLAEAQQAQAEVVRKERELLERAASSSSSSSSASTTTSPSSSRRRARMRISSCG